MTPYSQIPILEFVDPLSSTGSEAIFNRWFVVLDILGGQFTGSGSVEPDDNDSGITNGGPPGSFADGDIHIVGDTQTGVWAGYTELDIDVYIQGHHRVAMSDLDANGAKLYVNNAPTNADRYRYFNGTNWNFNFANTSGHEI